jgi:geranylgeranyl reductase family protein
MTAESQDSEATVAIVGAGPAGTATAVALGQAGVSGVVLADRHDFPRDKTCGSGVSPKGIEVLRQLGVWPRIQPHALRIRGLRLVTPGDRECYLCAGEKLDAVICPRRTLDHLLLERAQEFGATFVPSCAAVELIEEDGRVVGFRAGDGREVRARYTVIAGGTHCALTTKRRPDPTRLIQGIMGWWEGVPYRANHIEMVFDRMLAPYYGWLFPESDAVVNLGITYEDPEREKNARRLFQAFLDKHYGERLRDARQLGRWRGHAIAYDYAVGGLTSPGRIVVGEAGRMTHPATAEGIYQAMRSGTFAAAALRDLLTGRRSEPVALRVYEWRCKLAFEPSFLAGRLFRAAVRTPLMDGLVSAQRHPRVQNLTAKIMALM